MRRFFPSTIRVDGGGFNPCSIAGCEIWYDVTDLSSLTFNSGAISQINDKSGNFRHASQSTAANQPDYNASGLNGSPSLSFNGTSDFLKSTFINLSTLPLCIFAVIKGNNVLGAAVSYLNETFDNRYMTILADVSQGVIQCQYRDVTNSVILSSNSSETPYNGDIVYQGKTSTTHTLIKKARITSPTDNGNTSIASSLGAFNASNILLGRLRILNTPFYYSGELSEVLFYSIEPTTSEKNQIFDYLASKYSLTAPVAL